MIFVNTCHSERFRGYLSRKGTPLYGCPVFSFTDSDC